MAKVRYSETGVKEESHGGGFPVYTAPTTTGNKTSNNQILTPETQNSAAAKSGRVYGTNAKPTGQTTGSALDFLGINTGNVANAKPAGQTTSKGTGGSGGGGGGTATPATSVEAAAEAVAQPNPYIVDPVSGQALARTQYTSYSPSQDVLNAKAQMEALQGSKPGAYQASAEVLQAQQALADIMNNKPQGYTSKYGPMMDALIAQIMNPGQFNYEFNGDNLFKAYADQYTNLGRQASMDAMGQAAALTGGYGNSYAQQVGNQAYDQYLTALYDRGMDLRDRAYEQWLNEQQDKYNQYGVLASADATDYSRYRDTVSDWRDDRDYMTGRYDTYADRDYNRYRDTVNDYYTDLDYYTGRYDTERNTDYGIWKDDVDQREEMYQYDSSLMEKIREFDEGLNWEKMSEAQKYAASYVENILAMGQMPSAELLAAAGMSAEDAQKLITPVATGGGTGGYKPKTYYVDGNGNYYSVDENGKYTLVDRKNIDDRDYVDDTKRGAISGQILSEKYGDKLSGLGGMIGKGAAVKEGDKVTAATGTTGTKTGTGGTSTFAKLGEELKKKNGKR